MLRALVLSVALAALGTVAGCGFHRQGTAPMPEVMKVAYLESGDALTEFQRELRTSLTVSGVKLVDKREDATALLLISKDQTGRRVLSVSARNTPREYEIFYTVTYSVVSEGRQLLPPQTLQLTRDYSFDERTILAKEEEEDILRRALAKDLVGIVMRQLSSL